MTNITFFVTIKILNSQFAVKAATLDAYIILEMQLKSLYSGGNSKYSFCVMDGINTFILIIDVFVTKSTKNKKVWTFLNERQPFPKTYFVFVSCPEDIKQILKRTFFIIHVVILLWRRYKKGFQELSNFRILLGVSFLLLTLTAQRI